MTIRRHIGLDLGSKVLELLRAHLTKDQSGIMKFSIGWDDAVVADRLGVKASAVGRIRLKHFGPIHDKSNAKKPSAAMQALLVRVANIEDFIGMSKK